jgi:hypothetical protein
MSGGCTPPARTRTHTHAPTHTHTHVDESNKVATGNANVMMLLSAARAELTTLLKVDTKCTTLSLTPTVNGNTVRSFSTHGQQSAAQGSSTTVSRSDIRLIQYLDSSALGLVRRWLLTAPILPPARDVTTGDHPTSCLTASMLLLLQVLRYVRALAEHQARAAPLPDGRDAATSRAPVRAPPRGTAMQKNCES